MDKRLMILAGPASGRLGAEISELLGVPGVPHECQRFPDGEVQVELHESVRGGCVYLIQSTSPPVEQHLIELLLLADACRRAGAHRLVAVIPYFGYARQDRRISRRSLGGRVAADVLATAGFERLMLIDAHTPAIEGFFAMPIDHLTAVPLLARAAETLIHAGSVIVAPDLGAVKLARQYARLLHLPMAIVHKTRLDGEEVEAHGVIGDVRGRSPLLVDDLVSTGGTIEAAVGALRQAGAAEPMAVAVTHALLVGRARQIVPALPIATLLTTNTVEAEPPPGLRSERSSVAGLIAAAIRRDSRDESLADLRTRA